MDNCFDFVAIDFETANNNLCSACSIGLVAVKDNEISETFYSLIKPRELYFDTGNIEIHGINLENVKDASSFPTIWENIKHYFNGNMIIAHNAVFDMSVLKNCLLDYDLDMPNFNYLCSIPISTKACQGEKVGTSLKDRTAYFNIEIENHHNGLDDAVACAKLVLACIKKQKRKSFKSYCSIYSSLPIKDFQDLNPQKQFKRDNNKFNRVSVNDITSSKKIFDTSHPLYAKTIVFTGNLIALDRKTAMQKTVDLGGILKSSVSAKTDYLVVGKQDSSLVGSTGISTKEEKAYELIKEGKPIKILDENDFLKLISLPNQNTLYFKDTSSIDNTLDSMIVFNSLSEKMDKLKEWKLISPKAEELKDVYYKDVNGAYKCEVIGYLSKKTNLNCLDMYYETIIIKVNDKIVKIAPAYLLEIQKKDFSLYSQLNNTID